MKLKAFLLSIFLFSSTSWAQWKQWEVIDWTAAGSTLLVAAQTGRIAVLQNFVGSIQNAGYCYFHSGTAAQVAATPSTYKLTGELYFGANGFLTPDTLKGSDIVGASGEAIYVWWSTDPGGSFNIIKKDWVVNPS